MNGSRHITNVTQSVLNSAPEKPVKRKVFFSRKGQGVKLNNKQDETRFRICLHSALDTADPGALVQSIPASIMPNEGSYIDHYAAASTVQTVCTSQECCLRLPLELHCVFFARVQKCIENNSLLHSCRRGCVSKDIASFSGNNWV